MQEAKPNPVVQAISGLATTIILAVGIYLWAAGNTPGQVLAGKILVGLSLLPAILLIGSLSSLSSSGGSLLAAASHA